MPKHNAPRHSVPEEFAVDISSPEGQFVEFKQSMSDSLAKEIVGFANAEGGRIYVGVSDTKEIKGVTVSNKLLSQIHSTGRGCDPPITVDVRSFKYQGHDLLIVRVPEGKEKPYGSSGGYYVRMGASSQKLNRNELVDFVRSIDPVSLERRDSKGFNYPKDFNRPVFRSFLKKAEIVTRGLSVENLLVSLELARRDGKQVVVNNACALFFAKEPIRFLPQARVTCILYKTPERTEILDRKDLEEGLLENAEQAEIFLLRHLRLRYEIEGLKRIDHHEIPKKALREGIINSLVHRDFSVVGANVIMEIDPSQLRITNPGGLPAGLKPSEFGEVSMRRNPLVAEIGSRVGEVERAGSGIRRMREAVERERGIQPQFKFGAFFDLSFRRYSDKEWAALSDTKRTTDPVATQYRPSSDPVRQRADLLQFCLEPRSKMQMMTYLKLSHRASFRKQYLHPFLENGLLAMTDPDSPNSPRQRYVTTPKGRKQLENP